MNSLPKHMVTPKGGFGEPLTLCGLMSYPSGGITIHRDDVTCPKCQDALRKQDEEEFSFTRSTPK